MMGVDGTLWVELRQLWLTHLRHCVWGYDVMMAEVGTLWVEQRHFS